MLSPGTIPDANIHIISSQRPVFSHSPICSRGTRDLCCKREEIRASSRHETCSLGNMRQNLPSLRIAMRGDFYKQLNSDLDTARAEGLFKEERIITSAQQADITVADGSHVINFCANKLLRSCESP